MRAIRQNSSSSCGRPLGRKANALRRFGFWEKSGTPSPWPSSSNRMSGPFSRSTMALSRARKTQQMSLKLSQQEGEYVEILGQRGTRATSGTDSVMASGNTALGRELSKEKVGSRGTPAKARPGRCSGRFPGSCDSRKKVWTI